MNTLERVAAAAANRNTADARFRAAIKAAVRKHTVREVAAAAGISPGRVSQISREESDIK